MKSSILNKLTEALEAIGTAILDMREQMFTTQKLLLIHDQKIKDLEAALEYERTLRIEGK